MTMFGVGSMPLSEKDMRSEPKVYGGTILKVEWGSSSHPKQVRYFGPRHSPDAIQCFAKAVEMMDADKDRAAWASIERLPDSIYPKGMQLLGWTKVSDERDIHKGCLTPQQALYS